MNSRLIVPSILLGAAACGSGDAAPAVRGGSAPADPTAVVVTVESLTTHVPVEGTVAARRRAEIATRLLARVSRVFVEPGTAVRAGDRLVELGAEDVAANRTRASAARDAAGAMRDEAARHAARMDTLLVHDAVPRAQRDAARLALAQAEAQLASADAAVRDAETAASYATLRAPFDGVVASRAADPGDLANPGVPLVVVEAGGPRDGVFAVPADLATQLTPGLAISVVGWDGATTPAPVRVLARAADPATRTVEVRLSLPAAWPTGVAVTALVPAGRHPGLTVPAGAVVRRGQLTGVRVVMRDRVVLRWIRLGRPAADGERIEVLSGLEPGDRILP